MSSVIQNQNRSIRTTVATPPVDGQSRVYVTVPNVPICCKVNSVRIAANGNMASWKVTLLTDGAAHRIYGVASNTLEQAKTVVDELGSPTGFVANAAVIADFGGTYVKDATETGCLHLLVATKDASNFANGTTFTVTVDVTPMLYLPEKTVFSGNKTFRVLRKVAGGVIDLTQNALRNGNPYLQGDINSSERFTILNADTDEVYIGMDTPFAGVYVSIPETKSFRQAVRWDISTGTTTWTAVAATALMDNTSEGHATTPSGLSYTGCVKIILPQSTWTARKLNVDPLTVQETGVNNNTLSYVNVNNPARYWLRLRAASGATFATSMQVIGIQPLVA